MTLARAALLALNNRVRLLNIGGLHNWYDFLSKNWHFDVNSFHSFANNRLVNLDHPGDGWANFLFNGHLFLNVVWNVLLHVYWYLDGHLDGHMNWYLHLFVDWKSNRDFSNVWNLTMSCYWDLLNNCLFGIGLCDVTLTDSSGGS